MSRTIVPIVNATSTLFRAVGVTISEMFTEADENGEVRFGVDFTDGTTAHLPMPSELGGTYNYSVKLEPGTVISFAKFPNPDYDASATSGPNRWKWFTVVSPGAIDVTAPAPKASPNAESVPAL